MWIKNKRTAAENLNTRADEQIFIDVVEPCDFRILVRDQFFPVETALTEGPAKTGGVFECLTIGRSMDEQFFRNATHANAGATEIALFGDGNMRAKSRRHAARANTAGTGANHKEVKVVVFSHFRLPLRLTLEIARLSARPNGGIDSLDVENRGGGYHVGGE